MNTIESSPQNLKIIAGGGGAASKSSRPAIEEALFMATPEKPNVLIIPTPKRTQDAFDRTVPSTQQFFGNTLGLSTSLLHEFGEDIDPQTAREKIDAADMIYTTGGDTLHMMGVLHEKRLAEYIARKALAGSVVLSGISAGAILPMRWGHSNSLSYRPETADSWQYIAVDGLGLVPFAITPHFNNEDQRLGRRADQFAAMLRRQPMADAFGIDNFAAIRVADGKLTQFQSDPNHFVHTAVRDENGAVRFEPLSNDDSISL